MIIKKVFMLCSCFLAVLILSSCATTSYDSGYDRDGSVYAEKGHSIGVASILRFDDVPVPAGFKVLEEESFAFQNDVTRVALLKYAGGKSADLVVMFFKEQMPMYNWSPINIIEYDRRILNYEKKSESCIITIESQGRKSVITVAISPKSRPMKLDMDDRKY